MLSHTPNQPEKERSSAAPAGATREIFSDSLRKGMAATYDGLRMVTLNWIQSAAQDMHDIRAVLSSDSMAQTTLGRECAAVAAVSAERVSKLLCALNYLAQLLGERGEAALSAAEYINKIRDPLGHLKVLASDRLVSTSGQLFSAHGEPARDISLRTLWMTHAEEIDRLIHAVPE